MCSKKYILLDRPPSRRNTYFKTVCPSMLLTEFSDDINWLHRYIRSGFLNSRYILDLEFPTIIVKAVEHNLVTKSLWLFNTASIRSCWQSFASIIFRLQTPDFTTLSEASCYILSSIPLLSELSSTSSGYMLAGL